MGYFDWMDDQEPGRSESPLDAINRVAAERRINPEYLTGLARLETRLGDASVKGGGADTRNLFNIKDFSRAGTGVRAFDSAEGSNDRYRQYDSYEASVRDLVGLLERRYPGALNAESPQQFAQALQAGGYATDPNYATKLTGAIGAVGSGGRSGAPAKRSGYFDDLPDGDAPYMQLPKAPAPPPVADKPFYNDAYEVGRQLGAGVAVDLPRMVGQGIRWLTPEWSAEHAFGKELVQGADDRQAGWAPDLEGRGALAETLIKGARAVGPMLPSVAASLVPGGQFLAPAVAGLQFGSGSAQDTYDKLREQGVSEADAKQAGLNTMLIQGPGEALATAVGARAFGAARPLLGLQATPEAVARNLTNSAVLKPFAKNFGINLLAQPATEVLQDTGTELNERYFGAQPEDLLGIAKDSAQGGLGLTLLLGPLAFGGQVGQSRRAAALREALFNPNTPEPVRAQAQALVAKEAERQGVPAADMNRWLVSQLESRPKNLLPTYGPQIDPDASYGLQGDLFDGAGYDTTTDGSRGTLPAAGADPQGQVVWREGQDADGKPIMQPFYPGGVEPAVLQEGQLDLAPRPPVLPNLVTQPTPLQARIDQNLGLTRQGASRAYPKQFHAAASEPTNMFAQDPETGREVRLDAGQFSALQAGDSGQIAAALQGSQPPGAAPAGKAAPKASAAQTGDRTDATSFGLTKKSAVEALAQLRTHVFGDSVAPGQLKAAVEALPPGPVRTRLLEDVEDLRANGQRGVNNVMRRIKAEQAQADQEDARATGQAPQPQGTQAQPQGGQASPAVGGSAVPAAAPGVSAAGPAPVAADGVTTPFSVAGIDPNKTVEVGRKGREKEVTAQQLVTLMGNASPLEKARIAAAVGFEGTVDPTTGAPRLVQVGEPQTLDAIASAESRATGKKVTKEAIRLSLLKFGITPEVIDRVQAVAVDAVSAEELGIDPEENGSGFRVESKVSKAAGQGLVDDGEVETKQQREARAQADAILKEAGPSTALAAADDRPANLPEGAVVTDLRENNPAVVNANIQALLNDPEAGNAAADWESDVVSWAELPDSLKADWIGAYTENLARNEGDLDLQALARDQGQLEDEYAKFKTYAGQQAATGGGGPRIIEDGRGVPPKQSRADGGKSRQILAATGSRAGGSQGATDVEAREVTQQAEDRPAAPFTQEPAAQEPDAQAPFSQPQFSKAATDSAGGSTRAQVLAAIKRLMPINASRVVVVDTVDQLPKEAQQSLAEEGPKGKKVQAFVLNGRAYLVASNIAPGRAPSVFLHEVGSHLGMEDILSTREFMRLVRKVREWADATDGSLESTIAKRAVARVANANTQDEQVLSELVAYFVEEAVDAGVNPTALSYRSELGRWMASLVNALKTALKKLGLANANGLTAQDVVDLAYGAAHLTMQEDLRGGEGSQKAQYSVAASAPVTLDYLKQASPEAQRVGRYMKVWLSHHMRNLGTAIPFTRNLLDAASKVLKSASGYYDLMNRARVEKDTMEAQVVKVLEAFRALPAAEQQVGGRSLNAFIKASTSQQKWGYVPDHLPDVKPDPQLQQWFENELTPQAQAVVRMVFDHGRMTLAKLQRAVLDSVDSELDPLIAEARKAGDTAQVEELEKTKAKSIKEFRTVMQLRDGLPYAPLKRFGQHAVIAMSDQYLAAEANGDTAKLAELRKDENHYHVAFADTVLQAERIKDTLRARGGFADSYVDSFERLDESLLYGRGGVFPAFQRLRSTVEASVEGEAKQVADRMSTVMRQVYLTLLSETSARQAENRRETVAGASEDMMKAFATQGAAMASFIGSLKTSGQVMDQLRAMKREVSERKPGREERQRYYNEIVKRHAMGLDYAPSPFVDKALGFNSWMSLLTSPAYYLANLLQTPMVTQPLLAGRHTYVKAGAALTRAYGDLTHLTRQLVDGVSAVDALPEDVRDAMKELVNRGRIDIFMRSELGSFESEGNTRPPWVDKALRTPRVVSERVELVNRMSAGIAAYRLERDRLLAQGVDEATAKARAINYADEIIYDSHGDYSGFNAPRFMRTKVGRLATQFRKFQLIQLTLFAKLGREAIQEIKSRDGRYVASWALLFSLGHLGVMGGAMALPGFTMAAWLTSVIMGAFGDDEPDDPEATLRRALGGGVAADLLTKGVPKALGMDLSGKIGAGNMLSIFAGADIEVSRDGYTKLALQAAGPLLGGTLPRMADGLGLMARGDYYKGLEMLLPNGLANVAKGYRLATEGVTKRNGDVVLSAEEVGFWAGLAQAAGLPTNTITDSNRLRTSQFKADEFYRDRTSDLKRQYAEAYRAGNGTKLEDLRQEWRRMQDARRGLGLKVQPLSELVRAPMEQRKRETKRVNTELVP